MNRKNNRLIVGLPLYYRFLKKSPFNLEKVFKLGELKQKYNSRAYQPEAFYKPINPLINWGA
jgi:hypothetical protein